MSNQIVTEVAFITANKISHEDSYTISFPSIDKLLAEGWVVKQLTHLPVCTVNKGHVDAISLTVLLVKD